MRDRSRESRAAVTLGGARFVASGDLVVLEPKRSPPSPGVALSDGTVAMAAFWMWERLAEWPQAVSLALAGVGALLVAAFAHGFASKLGEEAASGVWRGVRRRFVRSGASDPVEGDGGTVD